MKITHAVIGDLDIILDLQKLCYMENALRINDFSIPPLLQTIDGIKSDFETNIFLKAVSGSRIAGSVRGFVIDGTGYIGRLVVDPEFQNQGLGTLLLEGIERSLSPVTRYELFTGLEDKKNIYLYTKNGYAIFRTEKINSSLTFVYLEKKV